MSLQEDYIAQQKKSTEPDPEDGFLFEQDKSVIDMNAGSSMGSADVDEAQLYQGIDIDEEEDASDVPKRSKTVKLESPVKEDGLELDLQTSEEILTEDKDPQIADYIQDTI